MDIQAIFAEIQTLPAMIYAINKREKEAIKVLNRLNKAVFKEGVTANCTNCHIKAYHKLVSLTLENLKAMNDKKFELKKNIIVEFPFRSGQHFNNERLTDELAAELLLNSPKAIVNFEKYPGFPGEYVPVLNIETPRIVIEEEKPKRKVKQDDSI